MKEQKSNPKKFSEIGILEDVLDKLNSISMPAHTEVRDAFRGYGWLASERQTIENLIKDLYKTSNE